MVHSRDEQYFIPPKTWLYVHEKGVWKQLAVKVGALWKQMVCSNASK